MFLDITWPYEINQKNLGIDGYTFFVILQVIILKVRIGFH